MAERPRVALVLGAGGLVGVAHHIGVLAALESEAGITDEHFELVVGTSAGSAVGAYLRHGHRATALFERVGELGSAAPSLMTPGTKGFARHVLGSAYVVARASIRVPSLLSVAPLPSLRRAFPAGLVSMGGGMGVLEKELPRSWPARTLWITAYDLVARRRVVLSADTSPYAPLPDAVRASCAIPGIFTPVRVAESVLVDGGAWSLTNLDLVAPSGLDRVLCIPPMAYDAEHPQRRSTRTLRSIPERQLARESDRLRGVGIEVTAVAPGMRALSTHGLNLMRSHGLVEVAAAAY